jgi:hypothetical protein
MINLEDITTCMVSLVGWDRWDVPYPVITKCEYLLSIMYDIFSVSSHIFNYMTWNLQQFKFKKQASGIGCLH